MKEKSENAFLKFYLKFISVLYQIRVGGIKDWKLLGANKSKPSNSRKVESVTGTKYKQARNDTRCLRMFLITFFFLNSLSSSTFTVHWNSQSAVKDHIYMDVTVTKHHISCYCGVYPLATELCFRTSAFVFTVLSYPHRTAGMFFEGNQLLVTSLK